MIQYELRLLHSGGRGEMRAIEVRVDLSDGYHRKKKVWLNYDIACPLTLARPRVA